MPNRGSARPWAPQTVLLLTVLWCCAMGWFVADLIGSALGINAVAGQNDGEEAIARRQAAADMRWFAVAAAGGLAVITIVAFCGRLPRTGMVYLVLALMVGGLMVILAASASRGTERSTPPRPGPSWCIERSGGDATCPGD